MIVAENVKCNIQEDEEGWFVKLYCPRCKKDVVIYNTYVDHYIHWDSRTEIADLGCGRETKQ